MAPPPLSLSLLWGLALLIGGAAASFCNVTCNTDYENVLNCSCSGSVPALPVLLNVTCRHSSFGDIVEGSCEIQPPQSWCTIFKSLILVAAVGTMCNTTASQPGSMNPSELTSWEFWNAVKLEPPVDVKVTNVTVPGFYNITWRSDYDYCVVSRVRIRNTKDPFQVPINVELEGAEEHFELNQEKLQPDASYVADVQVKYCKDAPHQGPWSEWSSGAEWSTARSPPDVKGMNSYWLYISTPIILVLALLLLGYLQKPCWQKKLRMITYIPRPNEYFKPLYQNYEGNFKMMPPKKKRDIRSYFNTQTDWVKPVFSEHDYLKISTCVPISSEKQSNILHWQEQSYSEDVEVKDGEGFTHAPQLPNNLLLHFQHSGASQGTLHSAGHVSIHTVTLSGEEFEGEGTSQSSLRSYQDGESFGSFDDTHREDAPFNLGDAQASRMDRHSGISLRENQLANDLIIENQNFQADGELNEERVSLDSFVSNEQSEDGYPHVDLDTIDSGFGECSSPGASDSHSNSFPDHKHLNSNYVKQWMICSTIQEDGSNVSSELNGTQQL